MKETRKRKTKIKTKINNQGKYKNKRSFLKYYHKGGVLLGKGSFGCVISPPVECQKPLKRKEFSLDKSHISKIVKYDDDDDDILNEISLGGRIVKIDPRQKFFSPIINACPLLFNQHNDIFYKNKKKSGKPSGLNDKKCLVYKNKNYLNLISKTAGINFEDVLEHSKYYRELGYLSTNYKKVMKHLLQGLFHLHKARIVHKDIKPENIMILLQGSTKKITYIDFGLSDLINRNNYNISQFRYILSGGTPVYTPPEIVLLQTMIKFIKNNHNVVPKNVEKLVYEKTKDQYKSLKYWLNNYLGLVNEGLITEYPKNEKRAFFKKEDRDYVCQNLINDYQEYRLIKNFCNPFGDATKWDVYSLGLVFVSLIQRFEITDPKCLDLINHMICIDYKKRYNVKECLGHPFFSKNIETNYNREKVVKQKENIDASQKKTMKKFQSDKKNLQTQSR